MFLSSQDEKHRIGTQTQKIFYLRGGNERKKYKEALRLWKKLSKKRILFYFLVFGATPVERLVLVLWDHSWFFISNITPGRLRCQESNPGRLM